MPRKPSAQAAIEKDLLYRGVTTPKWAGSAGPAAKATKKFHPESRRREYEAPGGGVMTERSKTVKTRKGWVNVPSLWGGRELSERDSMRAAKEAGWPTKSYSTLQEAEKAARGRSESLGKRRK